MRALVTLAASVAILGASTAFAATPTAKITKYHCEGAERVLFNNTNGFPVANGGARPTFSTHGKAYCVTYIQTYHWNGGKGPGIATGHVGLSAVGTALGAPGSVGSWAVTATNGQNNAPNVNWRANLPHTPPVVIRGSYTCNDSAPGTWSQNKPSHGGFCIVGGTPAVKNS